MSRATTNSIGGGSLRMKLLDRSKGNQASSAQVLNQAHQVHRAATLKYQSQSMCAIPPHPNARKSSSLQALAQNNQNTNSTINSGPVSNVEQKGWQNAERIGGKISMELANGSSANNSARGSRSSGLQEAGSDIHSVGGFDTAISHHHNAASLTRFDTENRDFDLKLAQIIQTSDGSFARGFWKHQDSLNPWTLKFNEKQLEDEYRAHFADSSERHTVPKTALAKHLQLQKPRSKEELHGKRPRYRYSGVFIDILVSAIFFIIPAIIALLTLSINTIYIIYVAAASTFVIAVFVIVGIPLLSRKSLVPSMNKWVCRHIFGLLLIGLPIGVALFNMPFCMETNPPGMLCIASNSIKQRLLYSFILLVAIYAHTNFSQLGAWPKTIQSIFVALLFLITTWFCQSNINHILEWNDFSKQPKPLDTELRPRNLFAFTPFSIFDAQENLHSSAYCNVSQPEWASGQFGSPLFIWELFVDVTLSVILVAFLNYQFETAFRISFFRDVQARRDTEKMHVVRDQADLLLTNILPHHVIECLKKKDTQYSENHSMAAVLFATITNWSEMYEENFAEGKEFLRVLNEVIADFDELLDKPEFGHVVKIKTIGSCYMAASGLNPERNRLALHPHEHLYQLMEFALALQNALDFFNQDLVNFDFVLKIGFNIGPVTAGVIGTTKLYYDIWGDTVNIASRMYSTGVENRIQVSQHTRDLLAERYDFEYRDHIEVKGVDGGMDTYLLVGRKGESPLFPRKANNF
uniref:adenylate cyclase n=1 Tax=Acrobeloides nanus TaxID=290746 RepID=A0A914DFV2_9BILA